ncbi:MAG: dCTP deaminase [Sedimentisphaerales bacterium]|nr:dCTP deaminase [Sedimentisphaerales bacterium]
MVNDKKQDENSKELPNTGVLTKREIEERLNIDIGESLSLVITPSPDEIDRDSVDLSLGNYFFVPRSHRSPCFIPGISNPLHLYHEQYVPLGSYLVLPAHHTVLGATLEYIKLPTDVSGEILTKSSWARTFVTMETAPWIHPLYRGCLTLEIANVSNTPVVLYPGIKIAQLILLKTTCDEKELDHEDEIEGTYIGPVRPEPAELKNPESSLGQLGVNEHDVVYPDDDYFGNKEFRLHVAARLEKIGYQIKPPSETT